eukprot:TRINITY_DN16970_c0_g1_i1.p1 TRINITY_DN16970_c0_g1~~TRINITY_DN16970_c0_g1_i1.p1  ORF type:complete len:313 (-),score=50.53 TRINITY_DN16970_c0_g1_i1:124-1062(-)
MGRSGGAARRCEAGGDDGWRPLESLEPFEGRRRSVRPCLKAPCPTQGPRRAASAGAVCSGGDASASAVAAAASAAGRRAGAASVKAVDLNRVDQHGKSPSWTIGTASRGLQPRTCGPGPGRYRLPATDKYWCPRRPAYSMRARCEGVRGLQVPGPGAYGEGGVPDARAAGDGAPKCVFGFEERRSPSAPNTPGPGAYDACGSGTGKRQRPQSAPAPVGPRAPPGPPIQPVTPSPISFRRLARAEASSRPSSPAWVMGTSKREAFTPTPGPAPGDYSPSDIAFRSKPRYSLGAHLQQHVEDDTFEGATFTQFV